MKTRTYATITNLTTGAATRLTLAPCPVFPGVLVAPHARHERAVRRVADGAPFVSDRPYTTVNVNGYHLRRITEAAC